MIFETEKDLELEKRAISIFVSLFDGSFKKLDKFDVDFRVYDKNGEPISYVEVKGRNKTMADSYPLPIAVRKLHKLMEKRLNPVVIWCCLDGIIYAKVEELVGTITYGGRTDRDGSVNDNELMAYYKRQKSMKYVRFI
jgi:hypothetical protein